MHPLGHDIAAVAASYEGVRYRRLGRSRDQGVDCAGLLIAVAREVGLTDFESIRYGQRPDVAEFKRELLRAGCTLVLPGNIGEGDIVRLAMPDWPVHCGIVQLHEGRWRVWHSWAKARKVHPSPLSQVVVSDMWRFPGG